MDGGSGLSNDGETVYAFHGTITDNTDASSEDTANWSTSDDTPFSLTDGSRLPRDFLRAL